MPDGRFGSVAVIEYIPKAAVRPAAIEGIADLAIRDSRSTGYRITGHHNTGNRNYWNTDSESFHHKYRNLVNYAKYA
jgi:hypothetical protein